MQKIRLDLVGQEFNSWTVLAYSHTHKGSAYWLCKCSCGTERAVKGSQLKNGTSKGCGCSRRDSLIGQKFGLLTVLSFHSINKHGSTCWLCVCDLCGGTAIRTPANLKRKDRQFISCGCIKGCKSENFDDLRKSNIRDLYSRYRRRSQMKEIEFSISYDRALLLFEGICKYCGSPPATIHGYTNGKNPFVHNGIDRIDNSKGYITGNVVTCCEQCNVAKADRTLVDFLQWIDRVYVRSLKDVDRVILEDWNPDDDE